MKSTIFGNAGSKKVKEVSYKQFEEKLRRWSKYDNLRIVAPGEWLAGRLDGGNPYKVIRSLVEK